jgi:hypothetical protein
VIEEMDWAGFGLGLIGLLMTAAVLVLGGFVRSSWHVTQVGAAISVFDHESDQATFDLEVRKCVRRQNHPCVLA